MFETGRRSARACASRLLPAAAHGQGRNQRARNAHPLRAQVFAVTAMWRHLASPAVIVIDDWNFDAVRQGTADGLAAVGGNVAGGGCVARAWALRLTADGSHTPLEDAAAGWWNGLADFVVDKGGGEGQRPAGR